jgi:membrane-bound inhibitor of C-type lysozyme
MRSQVLPQEAEGSSKRSALKSPVAFKGPVEYNCTRAGGGSETLRATFYETMPAMALVEHNNQARPAFQVISADGSKYEGQNLLFWEARGEATVTWSGADLACKPR